MKKFFIPAKNFEDWRSLLANSETHWRKGKSAYELALSWQNAKSDFPEGFEKFYLSYGLDNINMLFAFPEYAVSISGSTGKQSMNDLFVFATKNNKLFPIAVEGKAGEPFGESVSEWENKNPGPNKEKRLDELKSKLDLLDTKIDEIKYQLLHRTYSVVKTIEQFNTDEGMVLIHFFETSENIKEKKGSINDFYKFLKLYGLNNFNDYNDKIVKIKIKDKIIYFTWFTTKLD